MGKNVKPGNGQKIVDWHVNGENFTSIGRLLRVTCVAFSSVLKSFSEAVWALFRGQGEADALWSSAKHPAMELPFFGITADSVTLNFPSLSTVPFPCVFVSLFQDLQRMRTLIPVWDNAQGTVLAN